MNLSDMRTIVRRDLHDEDSSDYRWTDDEIDRHIAHAVREFSEAVPDEQKTTKATTTSSRAIDISDITNRVAVEAVEYPIDQFPAHFQRFAVWGDVLTLLGREIPDGSNAYVYYGKLHVLDASGSTIPVKHEDLVAMGAEGYAAVEWANYAINRVNVGGTTAPEEMLGWGREKLVQFRGELGRLGRKNRIRVRSLYRRGGEAMSRTRDFRDI